MLLIWNFEVGFSSITDVLYTGTPTYSRRFSFIYLMATSRLGLKGKDVSPRILRSSLETIAFLNLVGPDVVIASRSSSVPSYGLMPAVVVTKSYYFLLSIFSSMRCYSRILLLSYRLWFYWIIGLLLFMTLKGSELKLPCSIKRWGGLLYSCYVATFLFSSTS